MAHRNSRPKFRRSSSFAVVRPRRAVVALSCDRGSAQALLRAQLLSRQMDLELLVLHVVPSRRPRIEWRLEDASDIQRARSAYAKRVIQRWALAETGIAIPHEAIRVRFGSVVDEARRSCWELDAELLVVGGYSADGVPGPTTRAIVRSARVPVLLAGPTTGGELLVATDLGGHETPVVHAAARFARRVQRRVALVHNLCLTPSADPDVVDARHALVATKLERLRTVVRDTDAVDDATITGENSPAEGILRVARTRDADLVVVGARAEIGATVATILTEARRSILVVPVDERQPRGSA